MTADVKQNMPSNEMCLNQMEPSLDIFLPDINKLCVQDRGLNRYT